MAFQKNIIMLGVPPVPESVAIKVLNEVGRNVRRRRMRSADAYTVILNLLRDKMVPKLGNNP